MTRYLWHSYAILILLAGCGTGPGDNPYDINVQVTSSQPSNDCIMNFTLTSAPGDTGLRAQYHVWVGPDGAANDLAFFLRLGESETQGLARAGSAQPMKWELNVVRPRPGFSDSNSPNFGVADEVWGTPRPGGDYRRLNYTCGTSWNGI